MRIDPVPVLIEWISCIEWVQVIELVVNSFGIILCNMPLPTVRKCNIEYISKILSNVGALSAPPKCFLSKVARGTQNSSMLF